MKKVLTILFVVFFAASCNKEKTMKASLEGQWNVYKYLQYNIDRTTDFLARHPQFYITFSGDGKFVESFLPTGDTIPTIAAGTWAFTENLDKIELVDTINGNRFYTVFNLTDNHVQLRNDTSQLYMRKTE
jgi:hypothetical protein